MADQAFDLAAIATSEVSTAVCLGWLEQSAANGASQGCCASKAVSVVWAFSNQFMRLRQGLSPICHAARRPQME